MKDEDEEIIESTEEVSHSDIGFYLGELAFYAALCLLSGCLSGYCFLAGSYLFGALMAVVCLGWACMYVKTRKHKSLAGDVHYHS